MKIKIFIFFIILLNIQFIYSDKLLKMNDNFVLKDSQTEIKFKIENPWLITELTKNDPEYLDLLILRNGIRYEKENSSGMISFVINKLGNFDLTEYIVQDIKTITSTYKENGGEGELIKNFYPDFKIKPAQQGGAIYIFYNFPKEKEKLHQYLIYIKNKKDLIVINVFTKEEKILNEESIKTFIQSIEIK